MNDPSNQADLDEFFARLLAAPRRALFLDYDGTLAPFDEQPMHAVPYRGVRPLVDTIMARTSTRVVVVSGRWTIDLLPVLGFARMPEIWASHGWERLSAEGTYAVDAMPEESSRLLAEAWERASDVDALGGRRELKPGSLALHWRGASKQAADAIRQLAIDQWSGNEPYRSFEWRHFDGGIELIAPGRDKGYAVEVVLSELGPGAVAAYLGDGLTDEYAFRALRGRGLGVLVRPEFRETAADAWLRPPGALLAFLERWLETARRAEARAEVRP